MEVFALVSLALVAPAVLGLIEFAGGIGLVVIGVVMVTGGWTLIMSRMFSVHARLQWPPI